jgi:hypothetical protein
MPPERIFLEHPAIPGFSKLEEAIKRGIKSPAKIAAAKAARSVPSKVPRSKPQPWAVSETTAIIGKDHFQTAFAADLAPPHADSIKSM